MRDKVFIIAEAGVNHNGSIEIAKKMIEAAKDSGADAIKFQTFVAHRLVSKFAPKAEYQEKTTKKGESQFDMIKKLEIDTERHKELIKYCKEKDIVFLSSPFDCESIDLLSSLGLEILKIPSGEMTNLPYLKKIGSLRKKIIMSTGMSNLDEIKLALDILLTAGTKKENVVILHCNTEYPTPLKDVNLLAMCTIRDTFDVNVGYSDHTLGIEIPIAAVALGARVIEKHFTLNKNSEGPDHKASICPEELKTMVDAIRKVEKALGNGTKEPSDSELKNRAVVRKSIIAAREIKRDEVFTEQNITTKRPGTGISPMEWDNVIGKLAKKNFQEDEKIEL